MDSCFEKRGLQKKPAPGSDLSSGWCYLPLEQLWLELLYDQLESLLSPTEEYKVLSQYPCWWFRISRLTASVADRVLM